MPNSKFKSNKLSTLKNEWMKFDSVNFQTNKPLLKYKLTHML